MPLAVVLWDWPLGPRWNSSGLGLVLGRCADRAFSEPCMFPILVLRLSHGCHICFSCLQSNTGTPNEADKKNTMIILSWNSCWTLSWHSANFRRNRTQRLAPLIPYPSTAGFLPTVTNHFNYDVSKWLYWRRSQQFLQNRSFLGNTASLQPSILSVMIGKRPPIYLYS